MNSPSPPEFRRTSPVGFAAACCALMWLIADALQKPAFHAVVSFLILSLLFIPVSRRIRPGLALLGAAGSAALLAAFFVAVLAGLQGPVALWVICATMTCLAIAIPVIFAATFPTSDREERR